MNDYWISSANQSFVEFEEYYKDENFYLASAGFNQLLSFCYFKKISKRISNFEDIIRFSKTALEIIDAENQIQILEKTLYRNQTLIEQQNLLAEEEEKIVSDTNYHLVSAISFNYLDQKTIFFEESLKQISNIVSNWEPIPRHELLMKKRNRIYVECYELLEFAQKIYRK
ncbi:MAG: hypothetical protein AAF429_12355 [Pseudomonadota bacterium]